MSSGVTPVIEVTNSRKGQALGALLVGFSVGWCQAPTWRCHRDWGPPSCSDGWDGHDTVARYPGRADHQAYWMAVRMWLWESEQDE